MSTIALKGRGENFFGHAILRSVLAPVDEPDRSIIQQLIMERLLLGGVHVALVQGKGVAPRRLHQGTALRLGERRAPSCHRELGLLAPASGRLLPLAIDLEGWGISLGYR